MSIQEKRRAKFDKRDARLGGREARPLKTADQVYVSGKRFKAKRAPKYHTTWCSACNGVWLSGSDNIHAIGLHEAIRRGYVHCSLCATPISATHEANRHMDSIAEEWLG